MTDTVTNATTPVGLIWNSYVQLLAFACAVLDVDAESS